MGIFPRREPVDVAARASAGPKAHDAGAERALRRGTRVALDTAIAQEVLMHVHPTILCPVDFSEASAGALRYAVAIASHFETRLIVLTVEDPLLTEAMDLGTGILWSPEDCREELTRFAAKAVGGDPGAKPPFEYEVAVGKPAGEILRVARERSCGLIVMSSHGVTGARKLFFGSTTERVLRETGSAVLVTPPDAPAKVRLEDARRIVGRILVPVDLSVHSIEQAQLARTIAEVLSVPLICAHVIEPVRTRLAARLHLTGIQADRRAAAEDRMRELVATLPRRLNPETLIAYGDPAEELAKIADDRRAGLIVMGLHGSPLFGPRMGSVTYRLLCLTHTPVLAVPAHSPEGATLGDSPSASTEAAHT
jgi:universal stress protein A